MTTESTSVYSEQRQNQKQWISMSNTIFFLAKSLQTSLMAHTCCFLHAPWPGWLFSICPASRHFNLMNALTLESYPGMYSHHVLHFFCMKILTNTLQSSTAFLYRKAHFYFWIALSSKQQYLAMQNSPENSPDCCGTKTALTRKFKLNIFQWMTNLGLPEASESPKRNAN